MRGVLPGVVMSGCCNWPVVSPGQAWDLCLTLIEFNTGCRRLPRSKGAYVDRGFSF